MQSATQVAREAGNMVDLDSNLTRLIEVVEIGKQLMDERLRGIRSMGVRIALENFGAGYSSLDYLKRFPVDIIKIDPSLIKSVAAEDNCKETFRAVVALARSLAETTTVKGIESEEHLQFARDVGCDEAQGYFICPPLPVEGSDRAWQPGSQVGNRSTVPAATDASFDKSPSGGTPLFGPAA